MDDKTFIATFAAKETQRISEALKEMVDNPEVPSDEKKDAVIRDIEITLARLKTALMHIDTEIHKEDEKHVRPS